MISSLKSSTFLLLRKYGMTFPTRPKSPSPLCSSSSELLWVSAGSAILSFDTAVAGILFLEFLTMFEDGHAIVTRYSVTYS
jgi:hypothetical protein